MGFLLFFGIISASFVLSQNILNQSPGKTIVNNLLKKAQKAQLTDISQARTYAEKAIDKSSGANFKPELGQAHLIAGSVSMKLGDLYSSQMNLNIALGVFIELKDYTRQISTYHELGNLNYRLGQINEAQGFYLEAMALGRKTNSKLHTAKVSCDLADLYRNRGQFQEASETIQEAHHIFEELGDRSSVLSTGIRTEYLYLNKRKSTTR